MYDLFLTHEHSRLIASILTRFNSNILSYLLTYFRKNQSLSILEIGPGKGYFYRATRKYPRITYYAFDRNITILKNLHITRIYLGEAPKLINFKKKFHVIYIAYVIEHLQDGVAVYELIKNCKKYLYPGSIIVMLAPNTMSQGMEFWNEDYTHTYPTTKRNVAMAFADNGMTDLTVLDFNDMALWLASNPVLWKWIAVTCKIIFYFFNYRAFHLLTNQKEYDLNSFFYRLYLFCKAQNILFVARS
ncbi:MAG: type 11 methyltransferase [uncultured bacterium]|nr:MAG: type 11 methyltransferase [uncultured bacterium]